MMIVSTTAARPPHTSTPRAAVDIAPRSRVVLAIIGKELQQNWVMLALVICLEFIIVCAAEWFRSGWLFDSQGRFHNILLYPAIQAAVTIACPFGALMLGVLQPLADRNFDLWAFLNHRPVPRSWLFFGRSLAGLVLYCFAAGIPVALLLGIAPTRWGGHFFLIQYTLPFIADFFSGLPFYFAGLLIMERDARWYGSRVAPFVAAFVGAVAISWVFSFSLAILIGVLLTPLYAFAAWGSAVSHGYRLYAKCSFRVALGTVLFGGFAALALTIAYPTMREKASKREAILWRNRWAGEDGWWTQPDRYINRDRFVNAEGTIVTRTRTMKWGWSEKDRRQEYLLVESSNVDLDGHPVPEDSEKAIDDRDHRGVRLSAFSDDRYFDGYQDLFSLTQERSGASPAPHATTENLWYWVAPRRIFYAYQIPSWEIREKHPEHRFDSIYLGSVGKNGFQPVGSTAEPFDLPRLSDRLLFTPSALYRIDVQHNKLTTIFQAAPNEALISYELQPVASEDGKTWSRYEDTANIFLRATGRVVQIAATGSLIREFKTPPARLGDILWLHEIVATHLWVAEIAPPALPAWPRQSDHYLFYAADGKLLSSLDLPELMVYEQDKPSQLTPRARKQLRLSQDWLGAVSSVSGPVFWIGQLDNDASNFHGQIPLGRRFFVPLILVALVWALLAWLIAWVYTQSLSRRSVWALFALFTGPAALLTFVATHRLPRPTRCLKCRHLRLRRDSLCPYCGSPWPHPIPAGTEIWANPVASADG